MLLQEPRDSLLHYGIFCLLRGELDVPFIYPVGNKIFLHRMEIINQASLKFDYLRIYLVDNPISTWKHSSWSRTSVPSCAALLRARKVLPHPGRDPPIKSTKPFRGIRFDADLIFDRVKMFWRKGWHSDAVPDNFLGWTLASVTLGCSQLSLPYYYSMTCRFLVDICTVPINIF